MLLQLRRLERIRAEILELKQSTVAEIRSYQKPPPIVHTVMTATFLLLGHPEKETKVCICSFIFEVIIIYDCVKSTHFMQKMFKCLKCLISGLENSASIGGQDWKGRSEASLSGSRSGHDKGPCSNPGQRAFETVWAG